MKTTSELWISKPFAPRASDYITKPFQVGSPEEVNGVPKSIVQSQITQSVASRSDWTNQVEEGGYLRSDPTCRTIRLGSPRLSSSVARLGKLGLSQESIN